MEGLTVCQVNLGKWFFFERLGETKQKEAMKFVRIAKDVLSGKLSVDSDDVLGWQVIFLYNEEKEVVGIDFREIKSSTSSNATVEIHLLPGVDYDYAIQEEQGLFSLTSTDEPRLFELGDESTQIDESPNTGLFAGISQIINNLKANSVNFGYCFFSRSDFEYLFASSGNVLFFSLCKIDFMNSAMKLNEYANFYYSLKVELLNEVNVSTSDDSNSPNQTSSYQYSTSPGEETPVVLLSMPCPPHWRPGFSGNVPGF